MEIIPLCFFGCLDAPFEAFGLLAHLRVWILPGIAHQDGAHVTQLSNHETLRDTMTPRTIGVGAVLGETQEAVFGEDGVETSQVMSILAEVSYRDARL